MNGILKNIGCYRFKKIRKYVKNIKKKKYDIKIKLQCYAYCNILK